MSLGQHIRAARLERGLSLRQCATRAGISHDTLLRVEMGRQRARPDTLDRLASVLGDLTGYALVTVGGTEYAVPVEVAAEIERLRA